MCSHNIFINLGALGRTTIYVRVWFGFINISEKERESQEAHAQRGAQRTARSRDPGIVT